MDPSVMEKYLSGAASKEEIEKLSEWTNTGPKHKKRFITLKSRALQKQCQPKIVQETSGVMDDVYCAGRETSFKFPRNVLDEVLPVFPSKDIHVGGNECPKENRKRCPLYQAKIEELSTAVGYELQSYIIQRLEQYINEKEKRIIGCDEILKGSLSIQEFQLQWTPSSSNNNPTSPSQSPKIKINYIMFPPKFKCDVQ